MSYFDPYENPGGFDPRGLPPELLAQVMGQQYNPSQGYPLKQVSDQLWDFYGPTPDYLVAQQFNSQTPWRDEFSTDTFFQADPVVRSIIAEALANSDGDSINAYNYIQGQDDPDTEAVEGMDVQNRLRQEIGRTEWDQLVGQGDLASIAAITPEERDQAAMDYYMRGLEDTLAGGAPTSARNQAQYDQIANRMGGRSYPGAGQIVGQDGGGAMGSLAQYIDQPGQGEPAIDLTATPGGVAPGLEGLIPVKGGVAEGTPNHLQFQNGNRYVVLDGQRYQLPDNMAGTDGTNPAYENALAAVLEARDERSQAMLTESGAGKRLGGGGAAPGNYSPGERASIGGLFGPLGVGANVVDVAMDDDLSTGGRRFTAPKSNAAIEQIIANMGRRGGRSMWQNVADQQNVSVNRGRGATQGRPMFQPQKGFIKRGTSGSW